MPWSPPGGPQWRCPLHRSWPGAKGPTGGPCFPHSGTCFPGREAWSVAEATTLADTGLPRCLSSKGHSGWLQPGPGAVRRDPEATSILPDAAGPGPPGEAGYRRWGKWRLKPPRLELNCDQVTFTEQGLGISQSLTQLGGRPRGQSTAVPARRGGLARGTWSLMGVGGLWQGCHPPRHPCPPHRGTLQGSRRRPLAGVLTDPGTGVSQERHL